MREIGDFPGEGSQTTEATTEANQAGSCTQRSSTQRLCCQQALLTPLAFEPPANHQMFQFVSIPAKLDKLLGLILPCPFKRTDRPVAC